MLCKLAMDRYWYLSLLLGIYGRKLQAPFRFTYLRTWLVHTTTGCWFASWPSRTWSTQCTQTKSPLFFCIRTRRIPDRSCSDCVTVDELMGRLRGLNIIDSLLSAATFVHNSNGEDGTGNRPSSRLSVWVSEWVRRERNKRVATEATTSPYEDVNNETINGN